MKINPGGIAAVVPQPAKPAAAEAEVKLSTDGLKQLEKFVDTIHGAVDVQVAGLKKAGKPVPEALSEKKHAADELLEAARSGRSMNANEIATQLNALLWELNPAQLTQLRDGLQTTAKDFGELAKIQKRAIPGLPATLGMVVDLLTDAAKIPTSTAEVDRMLGDIDASLKKSPDLAGRLNGQRELLTGLRAHLEKSEAILKQIGRASCRERV